MSLNQRFDTFVRHLKNVRTITSDGELADLLKVSRPTVVSYGAAGVKIPSHIIQYVVLNLKLDANWFFTGQGSMLIGEESPTPIVNDSLEERLAAVEELTDARGTRIKDLEDDYDQLKEQVKELRGIVRKAQ